MDTIQIDNRSPQTPTFFSQIVNLLDRIQYGKKNKVYISSGSEYTISYTLKGAYGKLNWSFRPYVTYDTSIGALYADITTKLNFLKGVDSSRFYPTYRGKPLSMKNSFEDYGIPTHCCIEINLVHLQGGSTYNVDEILNNMNPVIRECEQHVLMSTMKWSLQASVAEDFESFKANYEKFDFSKFNSIDGAAEREWFFTIVENVNCTFYLLGKLKETRDLTNTFSILYRMYTGRVFTVTAMRQIQDALHVEMQSSNTEDVIKRVRGLFDGTISLTESPLAKKLLSLYSFLLTQGFLKHVGLEITDEEYSRAEQRVLYTNYSSKKSLIFHAIDLSLFICERYFEFKRTGEWVSFVTSSSAVEDWCKEADRLLALAPFVGNLQAHGTSYFSFISDLNDAIEKGDAYNKYATKTWDRENVLGRKVNQLKLLKNTEVTRKAAQQERSAPMGVLIHGHSSVAKSAFTKMLFNYYGALFDLERGDQYRYVRNPMDEYWSNFDTSKWCIQLDDIAFLNPTKTTDVDSTLQDLLNVVNNVPYVPPQAALEDKGKTPVLAKLVLATSNCEDLNALEYFWCPLAVRRRLPYVVEVEPKDEYKHSNGIFIDPSKMSLIDGEFPDWWNITVKKVVPEMRGRRENARLETVAKFDSTMKFLQHFGRACMEHEKNQLNAVKKNDDMQTIQVCKDCFLPLPHNQCIQPQAEISTIELFFLSFVVRWFLCIFRNRFVMLFTLVLCRNPTINRWIYNYVIERADEEIQRRFICAYLKMTISPKQKKLMRLLGLLTVGAAVMWKTAEYYEVPSKIKKACFSKKEEVKVDIEQQGNINNTTEADLPRTERTNVWYNPTLDLCKFDVPPSSLSLSTFTESQLRDYIAPNCVMLRIKGKDSTRTRIMRGFFAHSHFLVTNGHAFESEFDEYTVDIIRVSELQGLGPNHTLTIRRSDVAFHATRDVCVVEIRSVPPFKNLMHIWATRQIPITRALQFVRNSDGSVDMNQIFSISYMPKVHIESLGEVDLYYGMNEVDTYNGMCGSINVATTPRGPIIMGLHTAGKNKFAGFQPVFKDELEQLITRSSFSDRPVIQGGGKPSLGIDEDRPLSEPHHKSIFRFIEVGTVNIYGSFTGFRGKPRSRVCKTPLCEEFLNVYDRKDVEYGPPKMAGWEPWRQNVVEMVKPTVNFDQQVLKHCVEEFANDIISGLPKGWESQLVVLSDKSAVNGIPGVVFIDGINRKTSMGFPWSTSKKQYLVEAKDEQYPDGVDFPDDIWQRVRDIEDKYAAGQRAYPVFTGHLKDEATTFAKIEKGKTRLFTGAPVDWSLVVRKYLLPFVRLVQLNKYVFEAAPGLVTQSIECTELHDYLTQHGLDQIIGGDYGKFDKHMTANWVLAAFDVIIKIYKRAGHDITVTQILSGIAEDTAFPMTNLNNDLVEFFGTNPSGHPLTVIINSIVNALYMRYSFTMLNPKKECKTFKKKVALMTYGDDNAMGVSKTIPWFNHTTVQEVLAQIGVEYTMADKESESVPYISINDIAFLKRKWEYNEEVGAMLAPLDENSIIKSLTVWVPSDSVDKYYQMVAVMNSACCEYFFYGREKHEQMRKIFLDICEQTPYKHYVKESYFPDFDFLVNRFQKSSEELIKERSST